MEQPPRLLDPDRAGAALRCHLDRHDDRHIGVHHRLGPTPVEFHLHFGAEGRLESLVFPPPTAARSGRAMSESPAPAGVVARHPVGSFILFAYGWAWACWFPLLAHRQGWVSWSASPYLHLVGGLGPAAAALTVTAVVRGRSGVGLLLRRCVAWRGRLGWLAVAALAPLALFGIAVGVARIVDGSWPSLGQFGASVEYPALPIAAYWAANLLFYGYGEEVGWRGFLQPWLQRRRSALSAAFAVSVVWALWHLPLFAITPTYRAMPAVGFIGFYFSLLVAALVLAWLYLASRASILIVAVFHAVFDIATTTPTTSSLLPTLMGAAVTVAGLATIPYLIRARPPGPSTVAA
jgi:membrane protease YdiL (CAAX protease family)